MNSCGARRMTAAAAAAAIILVDERHFIVVDGDKPRIGDRRAMGVAGEIGEHARGSAERRLGVDDERALPQRAHARGEGARARRAGPVRRRSRARLRRNRLRGRRGTGGGTPSTARGRRAGSSVCSRPSACPSRATPPPGTRQWTWGWWVSVCPQVCRTAIRPILAPRRSAASDDERLRRGAHQAGHRRSACSGRRSRPPPAAR